jgi:hypothetical protein
MVVPVFLYIMKQKEARMDPEMIHAKTSKKCIPTTNLVFFVRQRPHRFAVKKQEKCLQYLQITGSTFMSGPLICEKVLMAYRG